MTLLLAKTNTKVTNYISTSKRKTNELVAYNLKYEIITKVTN